MVSDEDVKKVMSMLTPDQIGVAKTLTLNKIELGQLRSALALIKEDYDQLWKILLVIVHAYKEQGHEELRIDESQFHRFSDLYRLDRRWDKEKKQMVLRLMTITDEIEI